MQPWLSHASRSCWLKDRVFRVDLLVLDLEQSCRCCWLKVQAVEPGQVKNGPLLPMFAAAQRIAPPILRVALITARCQLTSLSRVMSNGPAAAYRQRWCSSRCCPESGSRAQMDRDSTRSDASSPASVQPRVSENAAAAAKRAGLLLSSWTRCCQQLFDGVVPCRQQSCSWRVRSPPVPAIPATLGHGLASAGNGSFCGCQARWRSTSLVADTIHAGR